MKKLNATTFNFESYQINVIDQMNEKEELIQLELETMNNIEGNQIDFSYLMLHIYHASNFQNFLTILCFCFFSIFLVLPEKSILNHTHSINAKVQFDAHCQDFLKTFSFSLLHLNISNLPIKVFYSFPANFYPNISFDTAFTHTLNNKSYIFHRLKVPFPALPIPKNLNLTLTTHSANLKSQINSTYSNSILVYSGIIPQFDELFISTSTRGDLKYLKFVDVKIEFPNKINLNNFNLFGIITIFISVFYPIDFLLSYHKISKISYYLISTLFSNIISILLSFLYLIQFHKFDVIIIPLFSVFIQGNLWIYLSETYSIFKSSSLLSTLIFFSSYGIFYISLLLDLFEGSDLILLSKILFCFTLIYIIVIIITFIISLKFCQDKSVSCFFALLAIIYGIQQSLISYEMIDNLHPIIIEYVLFSIRLLSIAITIVLDVFNSPELFFKNQHNLLIPLTSDQVSEEKTIAELVENEMN